MSASPEPAVLVCFTASYPYGRRETYFGTELDYLSGAFDKIIILPRYNPSGSLIKRPLPENVLAYPPMVPQGFRRVMMGIFNTAPVKHFVIDFFKQKVYLSRYRLIKWLNFFLTFRISYKVVRDVLASYPNAILYAYWAEAPLFLTKLAYPHKKMVRMHGADFYLDRNKGYLPLRNEIYREAQLLLPISENMSNQLREIYAIPPQKIFLSYLGVNNRTKRYKERIFPADGRVIIVSCSNLEPLKRVPRILGTLKNIDKDMRVVWHHFGDGPGMKQLRLDASVVPPGLTVNIHGWVSQRELLSFYNNHEITWFINVSRYEGLPVSIMEAFSAAIPVIATSVGGTGEIVNENNGILLERDFVQEQLAEDIVHITPDQYLQKSRNAYDTWKRKFDADANYSRLIKRIRQL